MPNPINTRFEGIVSRTEQELNLAEAALALAAEHYIALDVASYLSKLDDMAAEIRRGLVDSPDPLTTIREINRYLFVQQGYSGNLSDYSDPRNSFLNDVLDRKLGIPITLSVIYLELGWRLGLPLQGVSFPGHFLIKLPYEGGDVVLDPFFKGVSLGKDDLLGRVQQVVGDDVVTDAQVQRLLTGAGKKAILARIARNLRGIYVERDDLEAALVYADRLVVVDPDDPVEIRERGDIYRQLECARAALADYQRYLELCPRAADYERICGYVIDLHSSVSRLH